MVLGTRSFGIGALGFAVALVAACGGGGETGSSGGPGGTGGSNAGGASSSSGTTTGGTSGVGGSSTGSTGTNSTGSTGTNSTGTGPATCMGDADCANDPKGTYCDTTTGSCVACLPSNDPCPMGQFCDSTSNTCASGCKDNADCSGQVCDTQTHACVECVVDTDCPIGRICYPQSNVCVPGCSPTQNCQAGETCCGSACFDLDTNINNCGSCGNACPVPPNAKATCTTGACGMGACEAAFADCNNNPMDGCEWNVLQDGPCACTPGATQPCYQGAPGTENVGPCHAGTQTCKPDGTGWGACMGQVMPVSEICANGIDEDCNGTTDDAMDLDGDGWTRCNGDCCDSPGANCSDPKLVNPGAFEVVGNGVDDDCNPNTSDTTQPAACISAAKFTAVSASDVAKAMDICQTTTANPPLPQKTWGLITAQQLLANGTTPSATALSDMQNKQTAILVNYGTGGIVPKKGPTMAGISSGMMRDKNDSGYVAPNGGTSLTTSSTPPAAYLAAHGGNLPSSAGCSGTCPAGSGANDSVNIRLSIRVPTNAQSFSYDFRFVSSEYWTYQCSSYNDFYLALLQTGAAGIPADKNISFDSQNNPISVNNGFFDVCVAKGCNTCPYGAGELAGTGMEDSSTGGATKWLTTDAPVIPGETMQIELMVFDVSDHILDSLALLDNFRWNVQPSQVGTHL